MNLFVIGGRTVPDKHPEFHRQREMLVTSMENLGRAVAAGGHTLVACSPFEASADVYAIRGAASSAAGNAAEIQMNFPGGMGIEDAIRDLQASIGPVSLVSIPHPPPVDKNNEEARKHAWLLAQLAALETSQVTVAVGGKPTGAMSFLLPLAESRRRMILPFTFLGGAAAACFERQRYLLIDRLGDRVRDLYDPSAAGSILDLAALLMRNDAKGAVPERPLKFFISYARARPAEADFIETVLRRRQCEVFRDERDFGPGQNVLHEIESYLESADVFVAVWCQEYACSPWCFDELDSALQRHRKGQMELWLFRVDDTRIVPREARNLLNHRLHNREEIEGLILKLIEQLGRRASGPGTPARSLPPAGATDRSG